MKVHGHRAQIHIPADEKKPLLAYTRQGSPHKVKLPNIFCDELRRLFTPKSGYSVVDSEWLKGEERLFLFDCLKRNGEVLDNLSYAERYEFLPRVYKSTCVETLPVLKTLDSCLAVLERSEEWIEGLVFKAPHTIGLRDSAIVRCRKANP